jgi:cell division protein FtsB
MIVGLSILSTCLFLGLVGAMLWLGIVKVNSFKTLYLKNKENESLSKRNKKLKKEIRGHSSEVEEYSVALNDMVERYSQLESAYESQKKSLDVVDEVAVNIAEFHTHIKSISELQAYYGDTTIAGLVDHTRYLVSYLKYFQEGVIGNDEEENEGWTQAQRSRIEEERTSENETDQAAQGQEGFEE